MPDFMYLFLSGSENYSSKEEAQKIVEEYIAWVGKLRDKGKFKAGDELQANGRRISVADGKIIDGPFTETKESVGGYFLIEAKDYDEAAKLARDCPSLKKGGIVEVRQISDYS